MNRISLKQALAACIGCASIAMLQGCASLLPKAPQQTTFYALDADPSSTRAPQTQEGLTLVVNTPRGTSGFDSTKIIYLRVPHQLEYYAYSEWVDTPARMLGPLIVAAFDANMASASLRAMGSASSMALGELRLDTEILRLQQDFSQTPSHVRFTLRATLTDTKARRIIASHEFDDTTVAKSDDTYGGVIAANRAVQRVLVALIQFCNEAANSWLLRSTTKP
jgi:cholesterol transport system auxiliary component